MPKGTLGRLVTNGSFGFIRTEQGEYLFFSAYDLQGVKFNSLTRGQEVEFEIGKGWWRRPRAVRVKLAQRNRE